MLEDQLRTITYQGNWYNFPKFYQLPAYDSNYVPLIDITYRLEITSTDNTIKIPKVYDFTDIWSNNLLSIYTDDLELAANYTTDLVGDYTIFRDINSTVTFNIELITTNLTFVPAEPDHFYFNLTDHSMDISESWFFSLGPIFGKYDNLMEV